VVRSETSTMRSRGNGPGHTSFDDAGRDHPQAAKIALLVLINAEIETIRSIYLDVEESGAIQESARIPKSGTDAVPKNISPEINDASRSFPRIIKRFLGGCMSENVLPAEGEKTNTCASSMRPDSASIHKSLHKS